MWARRVDLQPLRTAQMRPLRHVWGLIVSALVTAETVATALAAVAALFAATTAWLAYRLQRQAYREAKRDEFLVAGPPRHPDLQLPDHSWSVLEFEVFNNSRRKAYIEDVRVISGTGNSLSVTWSDTIDLLGNPSPVRRLLGVDDTVFLYIRRNDGKHFFSASIEIYHSWSKHPLVVSFDETEDDSGMTHP